MTPRLGATCLGLGLGVVLSAGLAGCGGGQPPGDQPAASSGWRDQNVPIGSIALFDPEAFAGDWYVIEALGQVLPCRPQRLAYEVSGSDITERSKCGGARAGQLSDMGRFEIDGVDRWVLWADESYRTAVVASPGGSFAWILDRTPRGSKDRLDAAREILKFNGFSAAR